MSRDRYFAKLYIIGCVLFNFVVRGTAEDDQIKLLLPPRPARIYTQAPAGVRVMRVRAVSPQPSNVSSSQCQYHYELQEEDGFNRFTINECEGTIETARHVEEKVGEFFHVNVSATKNDSNKVATIQLPIEVTSYNKKAPTLTHSHYSQEILDVAPIGTALMVINGTEENEEGSSQKLFYFIQNPSNSGLNPWLYPARKPLTINYTTGQIKVSAPLFGLPESILFYIGVADDGSPQRSQTSKLTLYIRNMSAPRNLKIARTTEKTIKVCWSPPVLGSPDGYRISYNTRNGRLPAAQKSQGIANMTVDDLYKNDQVFDGIGPKMKKMKSSVGSSNYTNLTYCHTIEGLQMFTLYIIKITGWSSAGQLSMTSSPLTVVTKKKDCSEDLCNKGVCQEKRSPPGYTCMCMDGFSGLHCDQLDPCAEMGLPCKNGECKRSDESPPYCVCKEKFFGAQCQWMTPCDESKCLNGGTCEPLDAHNYTCNCPPLYTGNNCDVWLEDVYKLYSDLDAYCSSGSTTHNFGNLSWPRTYIGKEVAVDCWGPHTSTGASEDLSQEESYFSLARIKERVKADIFTQNLERRAKRVCERDSIGKPVWGEPNVFLCSIDMDTKMKEEFEDRSSPYRNIYRARNLSSEALHTVVDSMSNMVSKRFDRKKGRKIAKELSNLLKINGTMLRSSGRFRQSSRKILNVIHKFTENIQLKVGEPFIIREETISVTAKLLRKANLPAVVSFIPDGATEKSAMETTFFNIPKSAVNEVSGEEIRFKFVSFKDDRMFVDILSNKPLNMPVFSVAVGNGSIYNIDPPITYSIVGNLTEDSSATCVFWDEIGNSWSASGLKTLIATDGRVVCESNHLTAFSVLLDPVQTDIGKHSKILSTITYIGLALSTLALAITVATFVLFKSLRRDRSGMIVVNLSISLLLLNICFIFASVVSAGQGACILFAVLLHYSVAASFAWMLIEALNMHQLLVTVFPSVETHFLLKRLFFGWICPFFFVGVALSWDYRVYTTDNAEICGISSMNAPAVYYTVYLVPMILVLIINCIVFALVTRVLCQTRPESIINKDPTMKFSHKKVPVTLAQIRGAITVVALLGVTWVTGAFAIGSARLIMQYIFCITTPLQGFVIFVVRVIQSSEARTCWHYFLLYGIRGRQKLPPSSIRTHSSCQNTSSLNTQSTTSTPPTSVFVSALRAARRLSSASSNYVARSKSSMKNKRRYSSPTLKNNKEPVSNSKEQGNELYISNQDYKVDGQNEVDNVIYTLNQTIPKEQHQKEMTEFESSRNFEKNNFSDGITAGLNMKYDKYRDSLLIPEFENKYGRGLFSNDLATEILSNITHLEKEPNENGNDEKLQGQAFPKSTDVVGLSTLNIPEGNFFKAQSSNNLQNNAEEPPDQSTQMKAMSIYQMENLEQLMAAQNEAKSRLHKFSSENTLDKIQIHDYSPLLGYGSHITNKVNEESQNGNNSLKPD